MRSLEGASHSVSVVVLSQVLVVEDEPDIAALYRLLLDPDRYSVTVVGDLATAWRHLATSPLPALILLDRHLPDGDGLEFCRQVRTRCPTLPIVILTASGTTRQEALAAGADACLPKPFDADELETLVRGLLERSAVADLASIGPLSRRDG